MEGNVFGWNDIVGSGTDLSGYAWQTEKIPIGEFEAILDYKVWAKNTSGINCYFKLVETGELIKLTLFRAKDETYKLPEGAIDFRDCPTGVPYLIKIALNGKGNVTFKACQLLKVD